MLIFRKWCAGSAKARFAVALALLAGLFLPIIAAEASAAPQELWHDRVYLANPTTRLVADVHGYSQHNGADIQLWNFHGDRNQNWYLNPRPRNPHSWEIKAVHSRRCLDVEGESTQENARVQQWDCTGSDNQGWYPEIKRSDSWGQPLYRLRNVRSGLCLDVPTNNVSPLGFRLRQAPCSSTLGQEWSLNRPISNPVTGRVMDVRGVSTGTNAWVWLWNFEAGRNQYWHRAPTPDGYAEQIVVLHSRQCLDIDGGATYHGAPLVQQPCDSQRRSQRWQFEQTGVDRYGLTIYRIRNEAANRCVAVTAQPDTLGARLRIHNCTGGQDQQWRL